MTNMLRSPDRNLDPVQAFGAAAVNADHGNSPRQPRRSFPLRDELFNNIILNKTEQTTVNPVPMKSSVAPAREEVLRTNNIDQENTRLIAHIARQKSGIEDRDGVFHQV